MKKILNKIRNNPLKALIILAILFLVINIFFSSNNCIKSITIMGKETVTKKEIAEYIQCITNSTLDNALNSIMAQVYMDNVDILIMVAIGVFLLVCYLIVKVRSKTTKE